jgi:hypothetical protein
MCGYWGFPATFCRYAHAIREGRGPELVMNCYNVDGARKRLMASYVFCLDAWMNAAPPEVAAAELTGRRDAGDKNCRGSWPPSTRRSAKPARSSGCWCGAPASVAVVDQNVIWFDDRRTGSCRRYGGDVRAIGIRTAVPAIRRSAIRTLRSCGARRSRDGGTDYGGGATGGEDSGANSQHVVVCAEAFRYGEVDPRDGRMALAGAAPESAKCWIAARPIRISEMCAWFGDFMGRLDKWLTGGTRAVPELVRRRRSSIG